MKDIIEEPTAPAAQVQNLRVDPESDGQRLDNYLLRHLKGAPKTLIYRIIRSGEVRVNKARASAEQRVAAGDQVRVQPVAIRYTHRDGLPLRRGDMPAIGWYGDMDLLPHLKDLVVGGTIDVQVLFGETLLFDAQTDRKLITKQAENEVRRLFRSGVTHRQNPRISVLSDAKTV